MRALFDRYSPVMIAVARRVLNDVHEAEDTVNDVLLELWQKPDAYAPHRGSPRTFLLLVTRSRAIDRLRSKGAGIRGKTGTLDQDHTGCNPPAASEQPDHTAELNETRASVRQVLGELPAAQKDAVSLSFFDGLTHQQIAERTQQPLGTVKGQIRQGLIRLREQLRTKGGGIDP